MDAAVSVTPPSWLDSEGKAEWRRIVGYVAHWPEWLETSDRGLLAAYCSWFSVYVSAARDVAERGVLVPGRSSADAARGEAGLVKNRALSVMKQASTELRLTAAALGLDVWHRQRLDRQPPTEDPQGADRLLT